MDALAEINQEIKHYLGISSHKELAGKLNNVPEVNREALFNMISDLQQSHAHKTIIAYQVAEDVLAILAGRTPEFSKEWLSTEEA